MQHQKNIELIPLQRYLLVLDFNGPLFFPDFVEGVGNDVGSADVGSAVSS